MSEYFIVGGRKFVPEALEGEYWRVLPSTGDGEPDPRSAAQELGSAPDIVRLSEDPPRMQLTREWQLYLAAINPNMARHSVSALLGSNKAFTNGTGFPTPQRPTPRRNYILNENLDAEELPRFDKDRTCAYACHKGVAVDGQLLLAAFDGTKPPPPLSEINPRTHPHLYFHATVVYRDGEIHPFPNGAPAWQYPYNVVLMPLVAAHELRAPLSMFRQVNRYLLPYNPPRG